MHQSVQYECWQKVPGTADMEWYPFIRQKDCTSSNTYILRNRHWVVLIDPGAKADQAAQILQVIENTRAHKLRPVAVLLTHCHYDHSFSLTRLPIEQPDWYVLAHPLAAKAMAEGDRLATMSYLFDTAFPEAKVDGVIGSLSKSAAFELINPHSPCPLTVSRSPKQQEIQRLCLGGDCCMEVFSAPGHSPDSLCCRIGDLVFCGDLMFAAGTGAAGIIGWDRDDLKHSIASITDMLTSFPDILCCHGHGPVMLAKDTGRCLIQILEKLKGMQPVATLDSKRIDFLRSYSLTVIEELARLFSVLAGQLYRISYQLDLLGEKQAAEQLLDAIEMQEIDNLLTRFQHALVKAKDVSEPTRLTMPLNALRCVRAIRKHLCTAALQHLIQPLLLERIEHLTQDLMHAVRGFPFPREDCRCDLAELIRTLQQKWKTCSCPDEALFEAARSAADFRQALSRRLADQIPVRHMDISCHVGCTVQPLYLDQIRLSDILTDMVEQFAVADNQGMEIVVDPKELHVAIEMRSVHAPVLSRHKTAFYRVQCQVAGWSFRFENAGMGLTINLPCHRPPADTGRPALLCHPPAGRPERNH